MPSYCVACKAQGRKKQASFGLPGGKCIACKDHKKKNHVDVAHKKNRRCSSNHCDKRSSYGPNGKPVRCAFHQLPGDRHKDSKECKSCGLYWVMKYEECLYCRSATEKIKEKEMKVVRYLREHKNETLNNFTHDKISADNIEVCGKFRPDIVYELPKHFVIVEIDEHRHQSYPKECERARMEAIALGLGLPTTFIRFNPDEYYDSSEKKNTDWEERIKLLEQVILKEIDIIPKIFLKVKYLYYDRVKKKIKIIDN